MAEPALRGVLAVAQTPFHDDESLDLDAYDRQIDRLFGNGADRVVIGMVSEVLKLTAAALLRYFWAILAAVDIPVIIQDASGYIGPSLSIDLQAKLWVEFGDRVMFKPEADPIGPRVTAMREATDGRGAIFEGTGGLHLIDTYRRGVVGTMPAGDLVWALAALWHALTAGDLDRAYRIGGPLAQIVSLQPSLDSFVAVEKHLLAAQGVINNPRLREPSTPGVDA